MIRLEIDGYCQECLDFSPTVIKPQRVMTEAGEYTFTDTIIQCEHRKRCAGIERYLRLQQSKEEVCG